MGMYLLLKSRNNVATLDLMISWKKQFNEHNTEHNCSSMSQSRKPVCNGCLWFTDVTVNLKKKYEYV